MKAVQTLIFDKDFFTKKSALEWAKKKGFKSYTSRSTPKTFRVRQFPPKDVKKILGTFNIGKHIKGVYVER